MLQISPICHRYRHKSGRGFRYFFLPFPSPAHRFSAVVFIPCRYLLAQFQFLRISHSLKASVEERGTTWSYGIRYCKTKLNFKCNLESQISNFFVEHSRKPDFPYRSSPTCLYKILSSPGIGWSLISSSCVY
jgi:hypothetical protein